MAILTDPAEIRVAAGSLVALVGASGAGKTTFAARAFPATQVLSSDAMRAIVADDPNDQSATDAAFELLHTALALRLARGRTTVVDATNVERWARERLLAVARRHRRPASAIVLALPLEVSLARNAARSRPRPAAAIRRQHRFLAGALAGLPDEGWDPVWLLGDEAAVNGASVRLEG